MDSDIETRICGEAFTVARILVWGFDIAVAHGATHFSSVQHLRETEMEAQSRYGQGVWLSFEMLKPRWGQRRRDGRPMSAAVHW